MSHGETRIFTTSFSSVYAAYVAKAERKGRTKAEVDQIIIWLTGPDPAQMAAHLKARTDFETFFAKAPRLNPLRTLIKGVVCGIRVEEIEDPTMREYSLPRQTRRRTGPRKGARQDSADAVTVRNMSHRTT